MLEDPTKRLMNLNTLEASQYYGQVYRQQYYSTTQGSDGSNVLDGESHANAIYGNGGNDKLNGLGGNDLLDGGIGNDELNGGEGHDKLFGGAGNDTLYGEDGDDHLFGSSGANIIYGGNGDDHIHAGAYNYNDVVTGGAGHDTFHWQVDSVSGHDIITDFDPLQDALDLLDPYGAGSPDVHVNTGADGDVVIAFGSSTVELDGVQNQGWSTIQDLQNAGFNIEYTVVN